MAVAYVCDACGVTMTDPYEAVMREFYVGTVYDFGHFFPRNSKTPKHTVHLCADCYHGLRTVAERKERADDGK